MTADTPWDFQALPGFTAVRTYAQLSRDLAELWSGTSQQMILLSVETNETAVDAVRANLGRWSVPGAEVWNWWAAATAGFLGAYQDLAQRRAAGAPAGARPTQAPPVDVDLTTEEEAVDVRAGERVAAAEVEMPQARASTVRRRRSSGSAPAS
ncbi:MAG TPA: hypothetical protein VFE55_17630 [Acidimicrobiia bacterium]|nr:hypothetical protein [Acidimicrobiia bacterium]